jgi:hypothetical protein
MLVATRKGLLTLRRNGKWSRTSDNAGENWSLVNAHLPPIYAVRLI